MSSVIVTGAKQRLMMAVLCNRINQDSLFGIIILSLVLFACVFPATLYFLPQLLSIPCCLYLLKVRGSNRVLISKSALFLITTFPALCFLSTIWSITPEHSFSRAIKISVIILSYAIFLLFVLNISESTKSFIKKYFYVPLIMAGAYLSLELMAGLPILNLFSKNGEVLHNWILNKNVAVFALLLPLGIISLYSSRKKIPIFILTFLSLLVFKYTDSQSSWLCLLIILGMAILVYVSSLSLKLSWAGASLILLSIPFIAPYMYHHFAVPMADNGVMGQVSFSARLEIWYFISNKIMEQPWLGYGLDTTRAMVFDNPGLYHQGNTVIHPHNAVLQLWNDFGLFGILVVIGFLGFSLRRILQKDKSSQVIYGSIFAGLSIFLLVSWSLWASWLLGLILFLAILIEAIAPDYFPLKKVPAA